MADPVEEYRKAIAIIQQRALEAFEKGHMDEWERLDREGKTLQSWVEGGQQGPCPVDLAAFGIEVGGWTEEIEIAPSTSGIIPEEKGGNGGEEAPEQKALWTELTKAQEALESGRLREASTLAMRIAELTKDPALREAAENISTRARAELALQINESLEAGDRERRSGNQEAARRHYQRALELEPENEHARRALLELQGVDTLRRLKARLRERRNLEKLGEAIYEAEALSAEGKLPKDLESELKTARQYYDEMRTRHGGITTAARFGALEAAYQAREDLRRELAAGHETIWDAATNTFVNIEDYVRDVDRVLKEKSEETAQYELSIVSRSLPAYPEIAKNRLEGALGLPFHESEKRKLQEKLNEVEGYLQKKKTAENLIAQARTLSDPFAELRLLLEAKAAFPYLEGLEGIIENTRVEALNLLKIKVEELFEMAESELWRETQEGYESALRKLGQAQEVIGKWPEQERPPALENLARELSERRARVRKEYEDFQEYSKRAQFIREAVRDPDRRQQAKAMFAELQNSDLARFSDFDRLHSEMDQYAGVGELLAQARSSRERGNWKRVYELTRKILENGQAGALGDEVRILEREALDELEIMRLRQHLQYREIAEANTILSRLLKQASPERRAVLEQRLRDAQELIDAAIVADREVGPIFRNALSEIGLSPSDPYVKVYLHHELDWSAPADSIAGVQEGELKALLESPHQKTIQMAFDAARERLLAHLETIDPKRRVYALHVFRYIQGEGAAKDLDGIALPPFTVSLRTSDADRMVRLIRSSLRKDVLSSIRQAYEKRQTQPPDDESIERLSHYARLLRDAGLLEGEEERRAARWLQIERTMRMAKRYETLGLEGLEEVLRILTDLDADLPGDEGIRSELVRVQKRMEALQNVREKVQEALNSYRYREVIYLLMEEIRQEDSPYLRAELNKILSQIRRDLLVKAQELRKNDLSSIGRAALILLQLEELEEQAGVPLEERQSRKEMDALAEYLRLRFPSSISMNELIRVYQILQEAEVLQLREGGLPRSEGKWMRAVRDHDFNELRRYLEQIQEVNFPLEELTDYVYFDEKLKQWQNAAETLRNDIDKVTKLFVEEAYEEVVKLLQMNRAFRSYGRGGAGRSLSPEEYQQIREALSDRLRVSDIYDQKELVGWDEVQKVAEKRSEEQKQWDKWDQEVRSLCDRAAELWERLNDVVENSPLVERQRVLEDLVMVLMEGLKFLAQLGPLENEKILPPKSHRSKKIRENAQRMLGVFEEQFPTALEELRELVRKIYTDGAFPAFYEFQVAAQQAAQGNCVLLEQLVKRANTIGPGTGLLSSAHFQTAVDQARRGNSQPLQQILSALRRLSLLLPEIPYVLDENVSPDQIQNLQVDLYRVFSECVTRAKQKEFEPLECFFKYLEEIRRTYQLEEQVFLRQYTTLLNKCVSSSPQRRGWRLWFGG